MDAKAQEWQTVRIASDGVDPKDRKLLAFKRLYPVKDYSPLDFTNPHHVAAYAVWKGSQGKTKELLAEMPYVEKDEGLGKAFVTFLEVFGPDLEQFKNTKISLKFEGYALNKDTSVWYYYIVTPESKLLKHSPWVSVHRSRTTGRCALTGIFLYDPNDRKNSEPPKMPDKLIRSSE